MNRPKVVIIGGGGHAKVVIDVFQSAGIYEIAGYTAHTEHGNNLCGVPFLGDDSVLPDLLNNGVQYFFVAMGNNQIRKKLFLELLEMGFIPVNAISPLAYISPHANMGVGVVAMAGVIVNSCAVIGDNVILNTRSGVDHDCAIESHAHIAPSVSLAGCVNVGEGSFVGVGSSVIPEVNIGEWSIVGAGSVVISDVPSNVTVVGVPANKIIKRDEEQ